MKREIVTSNAPRPVGPYSQGLVVNNRVYVAGQSPFNPSTGFVVGDSIEEQTKQVIENIQAILLEAGAGLEDVVKCTVHLSDLRDFHTFNEVYSQYFKPPYPVRTTVGSQLQGILVEIDVIAERGE